jgi:hypothetical protein
MTNHTSKRLGTFIEAVAESLHSSARYNSGDSVAPAAILWTDVESEWLPIVDRLRNLMPEIVMLGEFSPARRNGPAIWMRCVIERILTDVKIPENSIPVLYLPNVNRQVLRAPEECPDDLKPLVELQYRGVVWAQTNGRDWTIEAFLVSENGGLGLEMARDSKTRQSLMGAREALAVTPISLLRGRRLEAEDFDRMMVGDTVRDLLCWINNPEECRSEWTSERWAAFQSRCKEEYKFDPEKDGVLVATELLGLRQGKWLDVWNRYSESPSLYPGIPDMLRRAKPAALMFDREPWPDENEKEEDILRVALAELIKLSAPDARKAIFELDEKHQERRAWVWVRLGGSPLATALGYLKTLAEQTEKALAGETPDSMGYYYIKEGYKADDAVLRALSCVKSAADLEAVQNAIQSLYTSWLDDSARNLQSLMVKSPPSDYGKLKENKIEAEVGECILFVDGLRYDIAKRVLERSTDRHLITTEGYRWAALPSVTPTGKPAVTPIAMNLRGEQAGPDFLPVFADTHSAATAERLRGALMESGYQVLQVQATGRPLDESARGWSEFGELDALGHKLRLKLSNQVDEQVNLLLDRIDQLLIAGWRSVRVVTDHGWLLAPGALPSLSMKKYMTECKWARCAVIKEGAKADVPVIGWFWDVNQHVAFGPGVHCFSKGVEYTHGGVSLQECLIPDLKFSRSMHDRMVSVSIQNIQWIGLRCRVAVSPEFEGLYCTLRTKPNDAKSAICPAKSFDREGRAGLLVEDENLMGSATILVVFDNTGQILCKQATIVGGES